MVGQGDHGEGQWQLNLVQHLRVDAGHEGCLLLIPSLNPHTGVPFKKLLGGLRDLVLQLVLNSCISYLYHVGHNIKLLLLVNDGGADHHQPRVPSALSA